MKRIMVLLTMVALMAVMMATSVAPAFAAPGHEITNPRAILTDLENPDAPYASGSSDSYLNGGTYVVTYKGPESPPGSGAAGGNPGSSGYTCHGPGC